MLKPVASYDELTSKRKLPFLSKFVTVPESVRTAFFPVRFRQARKRRCVMRRLLHVLEAVVIYALKRMIDWFFDTKN